MAALIASGLVHELVISVPAGGGYGGPTLFFAVQGGAMLVERSGPGRAASLGQGLPGRAFAAAILIAPAYFLFHPPFIREIVLPLLQDWRGVL
jgi:alginate O-acetyltransferase complex protein AlgI